MIKILENNREVLSLTREPAEQVGIGSSLYAKNDYCHSIVDRATTPTCLKSIKKLRAQFFYEFLNGILSFLCSIDCSSSAPNSMAITTKKQVIIGSTSISHIKIDIYHCIILLLSRISLIG